ncbi:hypothetical protein EJB05_47296, partial [Eragrostis curvula]
MDSDRVLILDGYRAGERVDVLMRRPSHFGAMVQEYASRSSLAHRQSMDEGSRVSLDEPIE